MADRPHLRVANPPPKPLMIWDGDCHFCRLWIERWKAVTTDRVHYATYQEIAERFPEIRREQFQRAVVFINTAGAVFTGAEAVYHSLGFRWSRRWLRWSYEHVPGFAPISEFGYAFIARHRQLGSAVTRLLWGQDVRPPTYQWARRWFLRALGLVYLIAFLSLWVQIDGLVGENGILPVKQFLPAAHEALGSKAFVFLPTLCWFDASNPFLHFLCGGGVVFSFLLIFGVAPVFSLIVLFVFYLSATIAGQTFLSFQWDILLLETGFLSIFFAPLQLWPRPGRDPPLSKPALFLLKLLFFKLMVMSGVVKLTSGDDCWWNLTALNYHYWSQPLPTVFAWWADKSPDWFKHFSVAFCLVVEIIVPLFIWAPRRLRLIAGSLLVFLQLVIAITGNYCFFNLLTIVLCLLLIDDAVVGVKRRAAENPASPGPRPSSSLGMMHRVSIFAAVLVLIVTFPINWWLIFTAFKPEAEWPQSMALLNERIGAFRIVNGYGLFRVMTKDRFEIVVEGSSDGIDWRSYEFKWKPGDVKTPPRWCAPHQPRLDWQMWFAALGSQRDRVWFQYLMMRLLEGESDVIRLFARNPFPQRPPRYVRALFYRYRFTTTAERRFGGAWWKRQELREYFPGVSLDQFR